MGHALLDPTDLYVVAVDQIHLAVIVYFDVAGGSRGTMGEGYVQHGATAVGDLSALVFKLTIDYSQQRLVDPGGAFDWSTFFKLLRGIAASRTAP